MDERRTHTMSFCCEFTDFAVGFFLETNFFFEEFTFHAGDGVFVAAFGVGEFEF